MSSETPQKVFISDQESVLFECPKCNVSKEADVTKFKKIETSVTLKVKCPCGNEYSVTLERRKHYRKNTEISGKFSFLPLVGEDQKGTMIILDISKGGLRFRMTTLPLFKKGDLLEIEFNLDNKTNTFIRKQVSVRNIKDKIVNVEFCSFNSSENGDKAIGFYLY